MNAQDIRIPLQSEFEIYGTRNYLVDVENVANNWVDFVSGGEQAKVFLFFSVPSPNLTYGDLATILGKCPNIRCFQCASGSNALDFQLVSYLGYLLAAATVCDQFVILSNDKGYDSVCNFWGQRGFRVERIGTKPAEKAVSPAPKKPPEPQQTDPVKPPEPADIRQQCIDIVRNCLPQNEKECSADIFAVLEKNKTANLQVVYQTFVKTYGQKRGLDLYKKVKSVVRKIQALLNQPAP